MKKLLVLVMCSFLMVSTFSMANIQAGAAGLPKDNPKVINPGKAEIANEIGELYNTVEVKDESFRETSPLKELDGSVYGEEIMDINKSTTKTKDSIVITIDSTISHNIQGVIETVRESTDIIEYFKDGEIKINNEILTQSELQSGLNDDFQMSPALASGGRTWLTHYKETSKGKYKLTAYKNPSNWLLDGSKGKARTKSGVKSGNLLTDFKNLARSVGNARDNIAVASATMAVAGIPLVWSNVLTALAAGGTIGVAALTAYLNSNSAKKYMKEAYNLL